MKNKTQSGSVHVIIIATLVIAVIGLLGFVFWQNFIQTDESTTTKTITTSESATTAEPQSTQTELVVGNYGVEVPYDGEVDTYTVALATTGGYEGGYTIYSKKVTDACGEDVNLGTIKRFNSSDNIPGPSNNVILGDYTYALGIGGYGDCGNGAGLEILESSLTAFGEAFDNLKVSDSL